MIRNYRIIDICFFATIFFIVNPSLALSQNLFAIFFLLALLSSIISYFVSYKFTFISILPGKIFLFSLLITVISAVFDLEKNLIFRILFVASPVLVTSLFFCMSDNVNKVFLLKVFSFSASVLAFSVIFQALYSPNLFGLVTHPIYNGSLHGTYGFRAIGFSGSPQNASLMLALNLFALNVLHDRKLRISLRVINILAGLTTLSSFFGVMLAIWFVLNVRYFVLLLLFTLPLVLLFDVENTRLEALNFIEIFYVYERLLPQGIHIIDTPSLVNILFGYEFGFANSGIVDRGYFIEKNLNGESWVVGRLIESGLIGFLFLCFVFYRIVNRMFYFLFFESHLSSIFFGLLITVTASSFVTPNFDSPRNQFLFWIIFFVANKKIYLTEGAKSNGSQNF